VALLAYRKLLLALAQAQDDISDKWGIIRIPAAD
jgi:hypothetical protein